MDNAPSRLPAPKAGRIRVRMPCPSPEATCTFHLLGGHGTSDKLHNRVVGVRRLLAEDAVSPPGAPATPAAAFKHSHPCWIFCSQILWHGAGDLCLHLWNQSKSSDDLMNEPSFAVLTALSLDDGRLRDETATSCLNFTTPWLAGEEVSVYQQKNHRCIGLEISAIR